MVLIWLNNEDYSYGFLIPVMFAYVIWDKRGELKGVKAGTSWPVLPVLLFFVALSLYGILGSSGNISMPAIPVLVVLLTAFLFGIAMTKRLTVALMLLFFMVPMPASLDRTVGVFLKNISSLIGTWFIRAFGITVHLSGNVLDLGSSQLQVVDACSGLRYILPLMALGLIFGYFFEKTFWKRALLFLVTIPISIFMNSIRIGVTGVLTEHYGSEVAEGFFHGFSGWIIFMVAFALLFLLRWLLKFLGRDRKEINVHQAPAGMEHFASGGNTSPVPFLLSICLLLIVGGFTLSTSAMPPVNIRGGMESFPLDLCGWEGKKEYIEPDIIDKSGAEEAFSGLYSTAGTIPVSLYMGYRRSAFLENENFFHSPTVCLPASGWKVLKEWKHTIGDVPAFKNLEVSVMLVQIYSEKRLVYYWFQTKDKASHDKNINRFHLAMHALKKDNTHDLFIRPITPIGPQEQIADAQKRMDGFVRCMMETLLSFLEERQYSNPA
jgi:exosortase D (VPLPA-CTERM-specific)